MRNREWAYYSKIRPFSAADQLFQVSSFKLTDHGIAEPGSTGKCSVVTVHTVRIAVLVLLETVYYSSILMSVWLVVNH